ncbi:hypothetical protein Q3G72_025412 [Acer saccharum]|nr:hypothetical protein Q3G72_025412 [Acer saccharum]
MIISKDRVKPSPLPDSWKLSEIFATKVVLGSYLALMTVVFFYAANETNFFTALIFVTRSRGWSFTERPGLLLVVAFIIAQLIATVISATTDWKFAGIKSIGWGWTGIIWLFNIVTYLALDPLKFAVRYAPSGRAWGLLVNRRVGLFSLQILSTALTDKKDFDKGAREEYSSSWSSSSSTAWSSLSKKELYLRTRHNLIHKGKLSFWFDLSSGKKCYMIPPRELNISDVDCIYSWSWFSIPDADAYRKRRFGIPDCRFSEVVIRGDLCPFEIGGSYPCKMLSRSDINRWLNQILKISNARKVFDGLITRNVILWRQQMTAAYFSIMDTIYEEALNSFSQMEHEDVQPNEFTFAVLLNSAAGLSTLGHGEADGEKEAYGLMKTPPQATHPLHPQNRHFVYYKIA